MKTDKSTAYKTFLFDVKWHARSIGFIVGILMIAIYIWILAGFINLFVVLYHSYPSGWEHGAEVMIKNIVIVLASLELIRVLQSYLLLGRVKVTFILDVALVVLIGELISYWYRDSQSSEVLISVVVIAMLIIFRIITSKYSPDNEIP